MKKKFCDACGGAVKDYYGVFKVNQRTRDIIRFSGPQPKTFDICESCSWRLRKTMRDIPYKLRFDENEAEKENEE